MTNDINGSATCAPILRPIGEADIKFLAAGEKINDIETAIRELIENSIDAQAKNIEVRLTKFGIDTIEVDDNGTGIDEANFKYLGVRYHTSKIRDYKNFQESLQTFGFRGEALSCLCNLANVSIVTKTKSAPTGCRLTYRKGGAFSQTPAARDTGTTVILKNLFHSLPVRRRELEVNGKRQYDKVVRLLYEQALARPHIKFSLCKKVGARKDKDFTHGGTSLEGCLITIFGIKIMDTLLAIRQPGVEAGTNSSAMVCVTESHFKDEKPESLYGNETGCRSSSGRESSDQSTINNDFSAINESTANDSMLTDDTIPGTSILDGPRSETPSLFYKRRSTNSKYARERVQYSIHGYISKIGCGRNSTDSQYIFVNKKPCEVQKVSRLINEIYRTYNQNQQSPFFCLFISVQNFAADFNVPRKRAVILQDENKLCGLVKECLEALYSKSVPASQKSCPVAQIPFAPQTVKPPVSTDDQDDSIKTNGHLDSTPKKSSQSKNGSSPELVFGLRMDDVADSIPDLYEVAPKRARITKTPEMRGPVLDSTTNNRSTPGFRSGHDLYKEAATGLNNGNVPMPVSNQGVDAQEMRSPGPASRLQSKCLEKRKTPAIQSRPQVPPCQYKQDELIQDGTIKVYLTNLEDLGAAIECDRIDRLPQQDTREFSFAIHPNFNNPAEDQLKLHLNRTSFNEMQVFGQFNCGFILTRLNKHIFIIDQHAADERANFEEQLDISPMVKQRMANPQPLYLNLIQENAILNNMETFKKHGFEFLVDTTKTVGFRVIQSSTSISRESGRAEYLGKEDIGELIDIAIESPARLETYTLKKVKNLAASIACRKSVMVGDKLTWQQMSQIVKRMSGLKNPWVCAHNRPTIRHLMDTDWKVFD